MLTALVIQWLTVQVSASRASAPAVIIAGADEITRPHLERLPDARERRGVPLTVMFRHLREDTLAMLGGGTAAFMRLGHHTEAEQAANFIGRQHTFVLSQRTATVGGNQGFTRTDSDGYGDGVARSRGWQEFHLGTGSRTRSTPTNRNWSTAQSWADGTSWSDAAATQRVYEYAVEPTVLQNLPDHALLLSVRGEAGPQLRAAEGDPAIAALPGVSTRLPASVPAGQHPRASASSASRLVRILEQAVTAGLPSPDTGIAGTAATAGAASCLEAAGRQLCVSGLVFGADVDLAGVGRTGRHRPPGGDVERGEHAAEGVGPQLGLGLVLAPAQHHATFARGSTAVHVCARLGTGLAA